MDAPCDVSSVHIDGLMAAAMKRRKWTGLYYPILGVRTGLYYPILGVLLTCLLHAEAVPPTECVGYKDLVFVVDSSESVLDDDPRGRPLYAWDTLKHFIRTVIADLPVAEGAMRISAVKFGTEPQAEFYLEAHQTSLRMQEAVTLMLHQGGNTNTAKALRLTANQVFSSENGARWEAGKVVVLITDGLSNLETDRTVTEARRLKDDKGAEIFTVAYSGEINEQELLQIASQPGHRHFLHVGNVDELSRLVEVLVHRICGLPDPVPTPPVCTIDGCVECTTSADCSRCAGGKYFNGRVCSDCMSFCAVCSNAVTCHKCQVGWYWEQISRRCQECEVRADMAFVIDISGSIRDQNPEDRSFDNFVLLKNFLKALLDRLDVGPETTRVGAVTFSTDARLLFTLDQYGSRTDIKAAIDAMEYGGGHTNTSGGLHIMRTQVFRHGAGNRPDARDIAIIITDGKSTMDANLTIPEASLAKQAQITLFVIGITEEINEAEAKAIASDPDDEHYFNSSEIRLLDTIMYQLIKHVCRPENPNSVIGFDEGLGEIGR